MATTFSNQLQPSNSTDALFRLWCTFVRDAFLAGWVQTADTGQMDFTTVTRPLAATTIMGYAIFRMDDSLQGSFPVYAKAEFGSGLVANEPRVTVTLGTGSNGSGTITGAFMGPIPVDNGSNGTGQTSIFSHSSTSSSHVAMALFVHATSTFVLTFSIERARDSSGTELGTHVVWITNGTNAGSVRDSRYLVRAGGTQPDAQTELVSVVCGPASSGGTHTEYTALENVSLGLILPVATSGPSRRPQNPALGYVLTPTLYTTIDAVLIVYVYGVPHVYKRLNTVTPVLAGSATSGSFVMWQRYE